MIDHDTIVAISSATGHAPRLIVRLCGNDAVAIATRLNVPPDPGAHDIQLTVDGLRFAALALVFRIPRSATGEDTVELHIPGNPHLARLILSTCLDAGARMAEPGEFTARAFFNGKLTLDAAEGVGAAVGATNASELRAARQLIAGDLAQRLRPTMDLLTETLALTEVGIDFSEEDVTFLPPEQVRERVRQASADLRELLAEAPRLERLAHTPTIVLAGRPNAGKSTLINALLGAERVVTSNLAGTTRDVIGVELPLPAGIVEVRDVAGLDDAIGDIEQQMRDQALRAIEEADVLVEVRCEADHAVDLPREPDLIVTTGHDRHGVGVSGITGHGLPDLRQQLSDLAFSRERSTVALNQRHRHELAAAIDALDAAVDHVEIEELVAADVRVALDRLGNVLGKVTPDDILGEVFGRFCVGK
ncbi:MAG: GTPase [Planctomycetota bacterium]